MTGLTQRQRELLRHMLGIVRGKRIDRRNHFVASPLHPDLDDLKALEEMGLVEIALTRSSWLGSARLWRATSAGRAAVGLGDE